MPQFFKNLAIFLFIILAPSYIILLSFRFSLPNTDALKKELSNQQIYQNIISDLKKQIDAAAASGNEGDQSLNLIGPILKQFLTPEYLQLKTEKLIDDTDIWLKDKTQTAPSLSFIEIKTAITKQNPDLIPQLQQLDQQLKEAQKSQPEMAAQTSSVDIGSIINSNFSIPLGNYLRGLKTFYKTSNSLLLFEGIFLLILAGLIVWASDPLNRFKSLSVTLLITSILGFILSAAGFGILKLISSPAESVYLLFGQRFLSIILSRLVNSEIVAFGTLFVISIIGLLAPRFMIQPTKVSKKKKGS